MGFVFLQMQRGNLNYPIYNIPKSPKEHNWNYSGQFSLILFYFLFFACEQRWLALFHQKTRYQHISWGTLSAALAGNRSAPPSWIKQVSTSHLASPNFSHRHPSKERPELCEHAEIWGCLEEPAGSKLGAAPIVFPLKLTHVHATTSWHE